jgi:hypothetical protein
MAITVDRLVARGPVSRFGLIALPSFVALTIFAVWHLTSTSFWYDESMQFWMSHGVDGFAPPLSPPGGLRAAIRDNAVANLDPGGFTLILRYWLGISNSESWQRLLPLLFFMVGMGGMGWIGWQQRSSVPFAVLSGVVPVMFPLVLDYAAEVRAYSMEFAGVVIGCALFDRLTARPNAPMALLVGATFGFFMTSRYGFVLFTCAALVTFVVWVWQRRDSTAWRVSLQTLVRFGGPIAVMGTLIFVFALWPQYKARISYDGGVLVAYLNDMTAAGKPAGEIAKKFAVNLLHPAGLPVTIAAVLGMVVLLPERLRARFGLAKVATEIDRSGIAAFALLCLAALAVTALLWPWHPWAIATKWGLWLQALSAVAVVRLAAALLANVGRDGASSPRRNRTLATLMLLAILALDLRLALYRRSNWPTFVPALAYLEAQSLPAGSVAMDAHSYPTVRYFYEYGSFASGRNYPGAFRMPYWNAPTPLVDSQTSLLLTVLKLADANRVFAPARIVSDPSLPDRLFRVEHPAANAPQ